MKLFWTCLLVVMFSQFAVAEVSLQDLGLGDDAVKETPQKIEFQNTMKERQRKLKRHEVLGLATLGLMAATVMTGDQGAEGNTHMYLGMATGAMYFTTAYYSLTAPKPMGVIDRGNIKWHKALAWVHFPAMVLAPILGYMYKQNEEHHRKSSSLVEQHPTVAQIGFGAFALSAALMTIEF